MLRAGFGFVECGTVTPQPQAGNPRPRLFRLTEDRAVINRMGFNNHGLEAFAGAARGGRGPGVVGANIGANKDSADRIGDYVTGLKRLWGLAAYFTINISSPNTPGPARPADQGRAGGAARAGWPRPAARCRRAGRGADVPEGRAGPGGRRGRDHRRDRRSPTASPGSSSPTPRSRGPPLKSRFREEAGGLSGAPLMALSTRVLGEFAAGGGRAALALIGVGGIASGADAYAKIRAGRLRRAALFGPGVRGAGPGRPHQARPGRTPARRRICLRGAGGRRQIGCASTDAAGPPRVAEAAALD